jgi:hypothetical protein
MSGGDLFGALQDDLVQHVLSFLPSRDAVETAVLARRWRYLWRSTLAVRVNGSGDGFRLFVNSLLLYRDGASPLRSFEIDADLLIGEESDGEYSAYDPREVDPHVDLWIRHALSTCRARSLIARFQDEEIMWSPRQKLPFASPHLTTMRLQGVELDHGRLDFSCCPALLHLSLTACSLDGDAIVSPSLERLHIMDCASESPTRISTPSLRHLQLSGDHDGICTAPSSLDTMPCLTNASIQLTGFVEGGDGDANAGRSLILRGLSEATSLELIATRSDGRVCQIQSLFLFLPSHTSLVRAKLHYACTRPAGRFNSSSVTLSNFTNVCSFHTRGQARPIPTTAYICPTLLLDKYNLPSTGNLDLLNLRL